MSSRYLEPSTEHIYKPAWVSAVTRLSAHSLIRQQGSITPIPKLSLTPHHDCFCYISTTLSILYVYVYILGVFFLCARNKLRIIHFLFLSFNIYYWLWLMAEYKDLFLKQQRNDNGGEGGYLWEGSREIPACYEGGCEQKIEKEIREIFVFRVATSLPISELRILPPAGWTKLPAGRDGSSTGKTPGPSASVAWRTGDNIFKITIWTFSLIPISILNST